MVTEAEQVGIFANLGAEVKCSVCSQISFLALTLVRYGGHERKVVRRYCPECKEFMRPSLSERRHLAAELSTDGGPHGARKLGKLLTPYYESLDLPRCPVVTCASRPAGTAMQTGVGRPMAFDLEQVCWKCPDEGCGYVGTSSPPPSWIKAS